MLNLRRTVDSIVLGAAFLWVTGHVLEEVITVDQYVTYTYNEPKYNSRIFKGDVGVVQLQTIRTVHKPANFWWHEILFCFVDGSWIFTSEQKRISCHQKLAGL